MKVKLLQKHTHDIRNISHDFSILPVDSKIIVWNSNPILAHVASYYLFLEVAAPGTTSLAFFNDRFLFAETGIGHVIQILPMTALFVSGIL